MQKTIKDFHRKKALNFHKTPFYLEFWISREISRVPGNELWISRFPGNEIGREIRITSTHPLITILTTLPTFIKYPKDK